MPVLYVLGTVWLWSLIPLAIKVANPTFSSLFIGFTRLAVGTCFFAIWELSSGRSLRLPAVDRAVRLPGPRRLTLISWIIIAGFGIGGNLVLYALGLRFTTASAASLVVSTDGPLLALLGVIVLGERMSWMKACAAVAALLGIILVSWSGQTAATLFGSAYFLGNVIVFVSGCSWAIYALGQRVLARAPGGHLTWIFLVGLAFAALVAFLQPVAHAPITWKPVAALLYLGLGGTGLGYVLFAKGLARLEAATAGMLNSLLPVFTMVQAHYFLHEPITIYLLGGTACVVGAVMLVMRHQRVYGT